MKVLIDIGHPAHVHLFKHFAWQIIKNGHTILFSVREKDCNISLLNSYGFNYQIYGKSQTGLLNKLTGLVKFNISLFKITRKFKPDISISHSSFYLSQICWLLHIPNVTLEDTGNLEQVILYIPFTNAILTSTAFHKNYGVKQIRYKGYHELAYLYPGYFKPNEQILEVLGLKKDEKFVLLRFVSWSASHDMGQTGMSLADKFEIIKILETKYRVFISSEDTLPDNLIKYQLLIPPERIHDVIYFADLYIGEGATMASECALLGTPAIYVNTIEAGTIIEQEKYGLIHHIKSGKAAVEKVKVLMLQHDFKVSLGVNREEMLKDKIDVAAFLVWFVENWPASFKIMKENPDYQNNFR